MLVFVQSSVSPNEMSFPGKPRASRKIYAQLTVRHSGSGKGKRSILSVVLVKRVAREQIPSSSRSPIPPFAPPILPFLHHTAFVRAVTQPTVFTFVGSMLVKPQGRTFELPSCAKRPVPSAFRPVQRRVAVHSRTYLAIHSHLILHHSASSLSVVTRHIGRFRIPHSSARLVLATTIAMLPNSTPPLARFSASYLSTTYPWYYNPNPHLWSVMSDH